MCVISSSEVLSCRFDGCVSDRRRPEPSFKNKQTNLDLNGLFAGVTLPSEPRHPFAPERTGEELMSETTCCL